MTQVFLNAKEFSMQKVGSVFKAIMLLYENSKEADKIYNTYFLIFRADL